MITELHTSPNSEFTEIITEPIIDEMSTNSRSVAGTITTVNLDTTNQLMNTSTITSKITNLDMIAQFAIDFGLKKI